MTVIAPHGSRLVNRIIDDASCGAYAKEAAGLTAIPLTERQMADLELIANGAYSPLEGFMGRDDYEAVVTSMHLASGLPWPVPVTLAVDEDLCAGLKEGQDITLTSPDGLPLAILHIREKYGYDREREAELVYRTADEAHPGVAALHAQGDVLLSGPIDLFARPQHEDFRSYRLDPAETRRRFKANGWNTIAGFETRSPIHRAQEYVIKCAMETADGVLLHPLIASVPDDEYCPETRMRCYEVLLEEYFPQDRVLLTANPVPVRHAGPRESVFHAIILKNHGCSHVIAGKEYGGPSAQNGSSDAQSIFAEFDPATLGITPLLFEQPFWSIRDGAMATSKTSIAGPDERISLYGSRVRDMLKVGQLLPLEYTRPEVARVLIDATREQL